MDDQLCTEKKYDLGLYLFDTGGAKITKTSLTIP